MSKKDVMDLLEKIQAYRQSFLISKTLISEWARILEPYDYEDVNNELDEYFKNGDNFGRYPDVYELTKHLKRQDEKLKSDTNYVRCQLCNRVVNLKEYNKHYFKCSSIDYICKMSEKYYKKTLNKGKLFGLSDDEFEKKYWIFCEKLIDVMEDSLQKHCLKNAILTHYGYAPEYQEKNSVISGLSKELAKND